MSRKNFSHEVLVRTRAELRKAWQQLSDAEETIVDEIEHGFGRCLPFLDTERRVMFEGLKTRLVVVVREALELKVKK